MPRVIWLHTQPEHYFNCMLDDLQRCGDGEYVAAFMARGPQLYKDLPTPQIAPTIFLRPRPGLERQPRTPFRPYHLNWRADLLNPRPDAIIVSGYYGVTEREVLRECHRQGIPTALWSDSNLRSQRGTSLKMRLKRFLKRRALQPTIQQADTLLTANRLGVAYWRYYGASKNKILRCPCYADYRRIDQALATSRNSVLSTLKLDPARRLIVTAARLVPAKALHLMIDAFRAVKLGQCGWTYVIAGTGPLEASLQARAGEEFGRTIRLLGFVQPADLLPLMRHADIFALPSAYEPHGIVIQEALAAGTPVLASHVCGAAFDLVRTGYNGWIFRSGNPDDLLHQLQTATADLTRLATLRQNARAAFEDWFAKTNPVILIHNWAQRVLDHPPRSLPA